MTQIEPAGLNTVHATRGLMEGVGELSSSSGIHMDAEELGILPKSRGVGGDGTGRSPWM